MHFYEIGDKLYLKMKSPFWNVLTRVKDQNGDSWGTLARKMGMHECFFSHYLPTSFYPNGKEAISLPTLRKLLLYMVQSGVTLRLEKIERVLTAEVKYGASGKPIKNPKFPLILIDPKWAAIEGAVRGDGSLYSDGSVTFAGKKDFVVHLTKIVKDALGDFKVTPRLHRGNIYRVRFPAILGQALIKGLRLDPGNKIETNPHLAGLYLKLDPRVDSMIIDGYQISSKEATDIIKTELQWLFSTDGWINSNRFVGLGFKARSASNLLNDVALQLEKLQIRVDGPRYYRVDGGFWSRLEITSKKYLELFKEKVGFIPVDNENNEKLLRIIRTYQKPRFKRNESLLEFTNAAKTLLKKGKKITVPDLAKEMSWHVETARVRLNKLVDAGLLSLLKRGGSLRGNKGRICGYSPHEYHLVET